MKHVKNGCINVDGENICKSQTKYTSTFPRFLRFKISFCVDRDTHIRQQTLQTKVPATLPRPSTRSSKETTRPTTKLLLAASWKLPSPTRMVTSTLEPITGMIPLARTSTASVAPRQPRTRPSTRTTDIRRVCWCGQ